VCREGFSVLYRRPRLFAELAIARGEGRLARLMATLERTRLLILDDWGPEPLTADQRRDLLARISHSAVSGRPARHKRSSRRLLARCLD
jgi:DNA replication protein DnaC